mmetsp:Transcript_44684/g.49867  ORF Transcript_44684/g.49867 Transcript_44684/m.49867 type:complete len:106 (+) Transcript_44684:229-546(+)
MCISRLSNIFQATVNLISSSHFYCMVYVSNSNLIGSFLHSYESFSGYRFRKNWFPSSLSFRLRIQDRCDHHQGSSNDKGQTSMKIKKYCRQHTTHNNRERSCEHF